MLGKEKTLAAQPAGNHPEILRIHRSICLMEIDIRKLKNDLESKINALIEVQNNFIKSSTENIKSIQNLCTHLNEDGTPATSKNHPDRLEFAGGGKYHKVSHCDICGQTYISATTQVDNKKIQDKSNDMMDEWLEVGDDDDFLANMDLILNAPISVIEKGVAEPMFVKKKMQQEICDDDGNVIGYKFVTRDVVNPNI